jgi:molybdopterin synthase catalytic subunit
MLRVTPHPFDPEAELAGFRRAAAGAGAIASFTGCVRGGEADALVLEHYPAIVEREILTFISEARVRFALESVLVIHRVGRMGAGEAIVLAAAASAHRKDALGAVDYLMDRLKTDAPFWKREETGGESRWIEPRAEDYAATARWTKEKP